MTYLKSLRAQHFDDISTSPHGADGARAQLRPTAAQPSGAMNPPKTDARLLEPPLTRHAPEANGSPPARDMTTRPF